MKNSLRITAMALAAILAAGMASCGGEAPVGSDTTTASGETTAAPVEEGYDYPDVDYGGYEFRILNFEEFYTCYMRVDVTEQTGETVDDAVQTAYYKECLQILTDEAANVYIQDLAELVALNKKYAGYEFYPLYVQDFSKLYIVE